ncbi:MAG: hypothetical protein Q4B95_09285 [Lonepinella koalarum]|nr:hypothetical protein [Lonepinella koalarum]
MLAYRLKALAVEIRKSHWIETVLSKQGLAIATQTPTKDDIVIVDVSEVRVNRPKKSKN